MQATSIDRRIPLPHRWTRHVRSAIVHAVSMANVAFIATRGRAEPQFDARARLQAENDRLQRELSLLREEIRIKDARMERVPAQRRPHYPPIEPLAILELRAARAWSLAQTARRLLVTPLTIASWTQRLDDEGPAALVQVREPVNRFPEFVGYLVQRLKVLCPQMGTRGIATRLGRPLPGQDSHLLDQRTFARRAWRSTLHVESEQNGIMPNLIPFRITPLQHDSRSHSACWPANQRTLDISTSAIALHNYSKAPHVPFPINPVRLRRTQLSRQFVR